MDMPLPARGRAKVTPMASLVGARNELQPIRMSEKTSQQKINREATVEARVGSR